MTDSKICQNNCDIIMGIIIDYHKNTVKTIKALIQEKKFYSAEILIRQLEINLRQLHDTK